jgi:hypothetical protein
MMRWLLLTTAFCLSFAFSSSAQDYSNRGLVEIKEQADSRRLDWNKVFDDAMAGNNTAGLAAARKATEMYLDAHLPALRRLYAEGDGRGLLTSVTNYLQIQKQFVKDVMVSAESIKPGDQAEIDKINQKIDAFAQKERIFLVEINNAMATEPEDNGSPEPVTDQDEEREEYEEMRGSVVEERQKVKRSEKLPHEKGRKKKSKKNEEEEDD